MLREMPKVELHAHLGGSVREATLRELMREKGLDELKFVTTGEEQGGAEDRMQKCFKLFDAVYKVTDNLKAIERITKEVVHDYAMENTKYLELRTSLKALDGKTETEYLETVLSAVESATESLPADKKMVTKILVSINRGNDTDKAETNVKKAVEYKSRGVVGVDFSGNCYKNNFTDFTPFLEYARNNGLPVTLHAGEKEDPKELHQMLDFAPDRVGHFIYTDPAAEKRVRDAKLPIEMCLSSNLITAKWSIDDHHVSSWLDHPISINCDDRGIFDITHTSEFELLQTLDHIPDKALFDISKSSMDQAFLPDEEKRVLKKGFDAFGAKYGF
eukprot:TRINITY_DN6427_c5_g1_i1.p1 TRINITY_DN6427_c5_g1~~TRINITY_DN6427_c5_g1_i1.p1  ORF type:complete len:353 (+),score=77.14 TRINITY_DN6427_c5_g1_i1:67-1059(+)